MIASGSINALTKLVLVNAIYFKGDWDVQFDKKNTHKGDFHVSSTKTVQADMMHANKEYGYEYSIHSILFIFNSGKI